MPDRILSMADFEAAVAKTIRREGGDKLTDDPDDPGGLTRYGISKRAHPDVDPRNLSLDGAKAIYRKEYWDPLKGDSIASQPVAELLFDAGVNMGEAQAVKLAQLVLELPQDGIFGPATLAALNADSALVFIAAYSMAKVARYVALVKKDPKLEKYFYGWVRRTLEG